MTLHENLQRELAGVIGQTGRHLVVREGPRTVRCLVEQSDAMAVSVGELSLETSELASVQVDQIRCASQSLCQRLTYLLEPILAIETDPDGCIVQMRSSPPQSDDDGRHYYELVMRRGGAVTLCRYEKRSSCPRIRVSATLTSEVVARLVQDFNAAVEELVG